MYQQSKNSLTSFRMSVPQEAPLFVQGTKFQGDSGLVLSTDAKPRLKWSPELHERFVEAVTQLGGADKATPKAIMRVMGIPGLTLYHLKSHLQKYRLSKHLPAPANIINKNGVSTTYTMPLDKTPEALVPYTTNFCPGVSHTNKNMHIGEALQMQIEVQQRLHEQLEVQRHLQLRIEAQGKYLQTVLQKAQETLAQQNLGSAGLEAARAQLSELVFQVSNECLNPEFSGSKEAAIFNMEHIQVNQLTDGSVDSCLTSCEGSQKEHEMQTVSVNIKGLSRNIPSEQAENKEDLRLQQGDSLGGKCLNKKRSLTDQVARCMLFPIQRNPSELSMNLRVKGAKESGSTYIEARSEGEDITFSRNPLCKKQALQEEKEGQSCGFAALQKASQLDLNASVETSAASSCRKFDLNGFTWN
ncbi:myb-related protein 2 [Nymphaea colorata]|uniref:myb-related protein 2 n=1 Tax=Nymphaea colorata TaxID=210225 RepID=UPI00129EB726|nr:myb-related protein 2 [Nymphaea colorata]